MTLRLLASAATCALAVGAIGCGGNDSDSDPVKPAQASAPPNPNDKRGVALQCIKGKGLEARFAGEQSIQVNGDGGPRIEFFVSSGEAEGQQFQGRAQGAEQIGAALLFINQGTEDVLDKLETCLDDQ